MYEERETFEPASLSPINAARAHAAWFNRCIQHAFREIVGGKSPRGKARQIAFCVTGSAVRYESVFTLRNHVASRVNEYRAERVIAL